MSGLVGLLIGAFIASFLVYALLHWAVVKRFIADRVSSRIVAAVVTYPTSAVLYGFGSADGNGFPVDGFAIYLLPTLIILFIAYKTGKGEREKQAEVFS